jgi:hypothetical protein
MPQNSTIDRLAAYADLVAARDRWSVAAGSAGVAIDPGECFGFASLKHTAPAADEVGIVMAQIRAVDRVLGVLWMAKAERLVRISRERTSEGPTGAGGGWCQPAVLPPGAGASVIARSVQIEFVGGATCLRNFVNSAAWVGLVVREISVRPVDEVRGRPVVKSGLHPMPLMCMLLLDSVEVAGNRAGSAVLETAAVWKTPATQPGAVVSELFAPPDFVFDPDHALWRPRTPAEVLAGVVLVAVRQEPCRWLLVGHAEGGAVLEEPASRRTIFLRRGESDIRTGVRLQSLDTGRGATGALETVATVADPGFEDEFLLHAGKGPHVWLVADIRLRDGAAVVRKGGAVTVGGVRYLVGEISDNPASIELTPVSGGPGHTLFAGSGKETLP